MSFPPPRGSSWSRDPACVLCVSCISRQILNHWATREAVYFSNLCQRLLVLWHLHTVIICSHFEYIKMCLRAWAAPEETPVFPCPSSPAVLTGSQMLVTEHNRTSLKHNRRRSSTFFPCLQPRCDDIPLFPCFVVFKKKSGVFKVLAWCLSQRSKVRCLPFAGLTHSPADRSWSGLRAVSTISTIMVPKWVCAC